MTGDLGDAGLTKHSSGPLVVTDGESGGSPKVDVKEGTATSVVDEKWNTLAATEDSDQRSPAVDEIISIRPRLKGHARKV